MLTRDAEIDICKYAVFKNYKKIHSLKHNFIIFRPLLLSFRYKKLGCSCLNIGGHKIDGGHDFVTDRWTNAQRKTATCAPTLK